MATEKFETLPEELAGIISVWWVCENPEKNCRFAKEYEVLGPFPRLNGKGWVETGPDVPSKCPECESKHYELNGIAVQEKSP